MGKAKKAKKKRDKRFEKDLMNLVMGKKDKGFKK